MSKLNTSKPYRITLWAAGLIIGLLLVLQLLLPVIFKTQPVRNKLLAYASTAIPGKLDFGDFIPRLLPTPHVTVTRVRLSGPGRYSFMFAQATLYPEVLPLLRARFAVKTLTVVQPELVLDIPSGHSAGKAPADGLNIDALKQRIQPVLGDLSAVLGDATVKIAGGRLDIQRADRPLFALNGIEIQADATGGRVHYHLEGRSTWAQNIALQGDLDLPSISGNLDLQIKTFSTNGLYDFGLLDTRPDAIQAKADLDLSAAMEPFGHLSASYRVKAPQVRLIHGKRDLLLEGLLLEGTVDISAQHLQVDVARLQTTSPAIKASAALSRRDPTQRPGHAVKVSLRGSDLDLKEIRTALLQLAGDIRPVEKLSETLLSGRLTDFSMEISAPAWQAVTDAANIQAQADLTQGRITALDGALQLENVAAALKLVQGKFSGDNISARMGNIRAWQGTLVLGLLDGSQAFTLETDLAGDLSEVREILNKLISDKKTQAKLAQLPPLSGTVKGRLRMGDRLDQLTVKASLNARAKLLDTVADISGDFDDLPSAKVALNLTVNGDIGTRTLTWLGNLSHISPDYLPPSALLLKRLQILRDHTGKTDIYTDFSLRNGPNVIAGLQFSIGEVDLEKLQIKDNASDARLTFHKERNNRQMDLGFSGTLAESTLDALFRRHPVFSGNLSGDLQAHVDWGAPGRSKLQGNLIARRLSLTIAPLGTLRIPKAVLSAHQNNATIPAAIIQWQDQTLQLKGSASLSSRGLNLDLAINSDFLKADVLQQALERRKSVAGTETRPAKVPFMIQGKADVKIGQAEYAGYRFTPLHAVVDFEPDHTSVEVANANLCGIDLHGRIDISKENIAMYIKPHARQAALRYPGDCLPKTKVTERIEGTVDLNGEITTQGRSRDEFIQNLNGQVKLDITDGRIYNVGTAGFFTNLLSFISLNQLLKKGLPDLRESDFKYNSIASRLVIKGGLVNIDEGVLKSNSINLVSEGKYTLASKELNMVVLVSPLTTVDWVVERVPIIGTILQGTLVAVPVRVKGPAADPEILPMAPSAVGSRIVDIIERILKTPYRLVEPILPKQKQPDDHTE